MGVFANLATLLAYDDSMASVFTRIINSELPSHMVWSDDVCVAFLSINPITDGHCLIVPRQEIDHWLDLSAQTCSHLIQVSHHVGGAIEAVFNPERVAVMIAGFEVPHTHIHVLGADSEQDLRFDQAASEVDHSELSVFADKIRSRLSEMGHSRFAQSSP